MGTDIKTIEPKPTIEEIFAESAKYFPTPIQQLQFFDKYSRFDYKKGRRETWIETVDRATNYLREISEDKLPEKEYHRIRQFILEMKATPSMRLIAMAGDAARRQNICIYNCSYLPVDSIDSFVEAMIISMSGCGVGFSVERKYVEQLPEVREQIKNPTVALHIIDDSTEGWAKAFKMGLSAWFNGTDVRFDYSKIRPFGTPLKVKGGRASGPDPLKKLLEFSRKIILKKQGGNLSTLDAHDIMCMVGNAVVSGGVRRSAMISIFDWDDEEMRDCKNGDLTGNEQRWCANNSAVWPVDIDQVSIIRQMLEMVEGGRGEPGIFNRDAANRLKPVRRKEYDFGTNPCGEINLRPYEFCNLSIAIARPDDTFETLAEKIEVATIIGTIQSMAVNFPGLRPIWKQNCEEERLLGVDINGQMDCPVVQNPDVMSRLKQIAIDTNKRYAHMLGINQSVSVTCVKPSGNSAQLFNCSSGLHARHYSHYIRNIRIGADSPIYKVLRDAGVPMDPENGQVKETATTWVAHFPVKAPEGTKTNENYPAVDQCEYWLMNKKHWTEHNPSVTISYKQDEVIDLIKWVVEHKDWIGGMSFLPVFDAQYEQKPYEKISKEEYEELASKFPKIDFSRIHLYEETDLTTAAQELACVSGFCEFDPNEGRV